MKWDIVSLDLLVLEKFERFADRFQIWTGKDCFFLAKSFLFLNMFLLLFRAVFIDRVNIASFLALFFLIILIMYFYLVLIELSKNEAYESLKNGLHNPFKVSGFFLRVGHLIFLIFFLAFSKYASLFFFLFYIFLVAEVYFASCTPLPPRKSKLRRIFSKKKKISLSEL